MLRIAQQTSSEDEVIKAEKTQAPPRAAGLPALVAGFVAIYLIWGTSYLGIKFAVETLPPFLMAGLRFILAGLILYVVLRLRGTRAPTLAQWRSGARTGGLLLLGGNGLLTWSQLSAPSSTAALLLGTAPMLVVVIGWLFYRGQRPSLRVVLGLVVGLGGAALLIKPTASAAGPSAGAANLATLAALAAAILWAIGSLEARRTPSTDQPLLASSLQMLAGGGMLLAAGFLRGEGSVIGPGMISMRSVLAFAYLTLTCSLVCFSAYTWLMRVTSPTAVAAHAYVNPLVAVLLGWLFGGEGLGLAVLLSAGLIIVAVVLVTLAPGKTAAPQPQSSPAVDANGRHGRDRAGVPVACNRSLDDPGLRARRAYRKAPPGFGPAGVWQSPAGSRA